MLYTVAILLYFYHIYCNIHSDAIYQHGMPNYDVQLSYSNGWSQETNDRTLGKEVASNINEILNLFCVFGILD